MWCCNASLVVRCVQWNVLEVFVWFNAVMWLFISLWFLEFITAYSRLSGCEVRYILGLLWCFCIGLRWALESWVEKVSVLKVRLFCWVVKSIHKVFCLRLHYIVGEITKRRKLKFDVFITTSSNGVTEVSDVFFLIRYACVRLFSTYRRFFLFCL